MLAHIRAFDADGAPAPTLRGWLGVLGILTGLLLAGCADAPRSPVAGPDPADPGARAPRVDYRSTVDRCRARAAVQPRAPAYNCDSQVIGGRLMRSGPRPLNASSSTGRITQAGL